MSDKVQTLRGFRDYLKADAQNREWLISKIKNVFKRHGFEPLETPALEYESLLLGKYGAEAEKLIYRFEDNGKRKVALRYDQTVPTARVVAQYQNDINFPYRRYQVQNVWRADKPQKGRLREFTQCDADIIGSDNPTSDAEILAVYAAIYYEIGFGNFKIKINDRETLINNIKDAGVNDDMIFSVIQTIDKLDKKSKEEVLKELKDRGVEEKNANKLLEMLEKAKLPKKLATIINYAKQLGVKADTFQFEPTLARGLDYYTDVIFEGSIPEYSAGSVGAGGRYNNLLNDLVGVDMPAVGFGLGFDRTLEAAKELGKLPKKQTTTQVLVTIFSEEQMEDSLQVTNLLRKNNVQVECYPDTAKINKQLKYANNKEIPYVVIIGPEEKTNKTVQLKNMQSGEQKNVNIDELSEINF